MKTMISIATLMLMASGASHAADRVGDFALIDSQGDFHKMSYYDNHKGIALLTYSNDAKGMAETVAAFKQAQAKYKEQIRFFLIDPSSDKPQAVQSRVKALDTDIRVLMDDTQLASKSLGIERVGQIVLLNQQSLEVVYRGTASQPFEAAIDQLVAGKPVANSSVAVKGEKVSYSKEALAKSSLSYSKDIAPILAQNCAHCHRADGVAPFAMNSHAVIKGFAPMIREVVMTKRMPPGQIDPSIGHFKNSYALSPLETQKLINWINAGAKQDGKIDPLTQLKWPDSKWSLGKPDLIIKVPPQAVPATGVLAMIDVKVPLEGLDRDRYVRASEYLPSERSVLHHTVTAVLPPETPGAPSGLFGAYSADGARIVSYTPGAAPLVEPANTGGLLKKGSSLALNLHYTTNGKATSDASEIGIWFYPDDQVPTERMSLQCACAIGGWKNIPAFAANHEMQRTVTLPKETDVYSMAPHMHFRGKRMRFYADYPNGTHEELLNIANYQYNWQYNYELVTPKRMPAGTKITAIAAFDNSPQNKANPDPSRRVPFGEQSWDEMMFGAITVKYIEPSAAKSAAR